MTDITCPSCQMVNPQGLTTCQYCLCTLHSSPVRATSDGVDPAMTAPSRRPPVTETTHDPASEAHRPHPSARVTEWGCPCGGANSTADELCGKCGSPRPPDDCGPVHRAPGTTGPSPALIILLLPTGTEVQLRRGETLRLGRRSDMAAVAAALDAYPGVSRQHAALTAETSTVIVRDFSSLNGTWANGTRVTESLRMAADELATLRLGQQAVIHVRPGTNTMDFTFTGRRGGT